MGREIPCRGLTVCILLGTVPSGKWSGTGGVMSTERQPRDVQRNAAPCNNISRHRGALDAFLRARNDLTERQREAVDLLLHGASDQEVATQLAVERSTIFRWRKSVPFQRELERQRRDVWERSVTQLQSMVQPALEILQRQLTSEDVKLQIRAATILLRFATPSRLAPGRTTAGDNSPAREPHDQEVDDLIDYINAPLPGQPRAMEDMPNEEAD